MRFSYSHRVISLSFNKAEAKTEKYHERREKKKQIKILTHSETVKRTHQINVNERKTEKEDKKKLTT